MCPVFTSFSHRLERSRGQNDTDFAAAADSAAAEQTAPSGLPDCFKLRFRRSQRIRSSSRATRTGL